MTLMVDHLKVVEWKMHLWIVQLNACERSNSVFNEKSEFPAIHISSWIAFLQLLFIVE